VFWVIEEHAKPVGCIAAHVADDHVALHSVYLEPSAQGRGIGTQVLAMMLARLPALPVRVEVLKGSPARRFWEGQGFRFVEAQDFDDLMERPAQPAAATAGE